MFRQLTTIVLLFAFSAQVFNRAAIVLDYYTNKTAFAKNCENKLRPKLHCNGKCQMMKKLKEEERKEQQAPERKGENKNEIVSSESFFSTVIFKTINAHPSYSSFYLIAFPQGINTAIFHPPGLV